MQENRRNKSTLELYSEARPGFSASWIEIWNMLGLDGQAPRHILDVGCGTGRSSSWLSLGAEWVTAIDRGRESLQVASREFAGENVTFYHCDAEKLGHLDIQGQHIDAVVFCGSLEWIELPSFRKSLAELGAKSVPVVCQWTWFDCRDQLTREWHLLFRKFLGHQYGQEPDEVLWKAYGNLDSPRYICRKLKQFYSPIELENLVKSSSYWRERSLPWNSEGLRDSVGRFVGNYSGDKNIELAFVEISVGGTMKCL